MSRFNLNLGFLFGLGLAGCQVIVGITDRTTGPDAGTPGGGSDGSGGDGTSGSSSSAGGSGSAGKGTAGSGGGGGGTSGSGSGATAGGGKGGTSGSGSGAAAGRGGAAPGTGGSVVGSGGTTAVAGSGESFCLVGGPVGAAGSCNAPLTCTPKPGTFIGVCTAPCATTADCAAGHFCLPTANGSLCVKDCSAGCASQGFACFTPPSGQPYCIPDPWFFGRFGDVCHDDSNCLSNYCVGTCIDCTDNSDCSLTPSGQDICGFVSGSPHAICFHDCSGDPNICSRYFSEPASSCTPISGSLSTCGY